MGDELVALVEGSWQVFLHAPAEVYLLEVYQELVRDCFEVHGVRGIGEDAVLRTVHAHGPSLQVEIRPPEEVYPLRSDQKQRNCSLLQHN